MRDWRILIMVSGRERRVFTDNYITKIMSNASISNSRLGITITITCRESKLGVGNHRGGIDVDVITAP
jgi:hypothetical protein